MSSQQEQTQLSSSSAVDSAAATKKKKAPPPNLVIPPPRPKLSKEERRALQEQQRAAKLSASSGAKVAPSSAKVTATQSTSTTQTNVETKTTLTTQSDTSVKSIVGKSKAEVKGSNDITSSLPTAAKSEISFVSHLSPFRDPSIMFDTGAVLRPKVSAATSSNNVDMVSSLHPSIIHLGYQYAIGTIRGANSRCRSMLDCYSTVLQDFVANSKPENQTNIDWRSTIENTILKPAFTYWTEHCRPHSVSMGNAFTFLKTAVNTFDREASLEHIIATLLDTIAAYIRERIDYAKAAIAETACTKLLFRRIDHNASTNSKMEVFLTYGHSEAVLAVLSKAISSRKKNLRMVVVDSPPLLEGRILLEKLQQEASNAAATIDQTNTDVCNTVEFTYIHLHAVTYVLPSVSKVLLGAAALQTDGSVTGRIGTAVIALAAHMKNIPVLVCSETHKISNRGVPLESLTQNELYGDSSSPKNKINDTGIEKKPNRIDLRYDLTPASFVSGIVTELGIVPPSSVAVLLRELNQTPGSVQQ